MWTHTLITYRIIIHCISWHKNFEFSSRSRILQCVLWIIFNVNWALIPYLGSFFSSDKKTKHERWAGINPLSNFVYFTVKNPEIDLACSSLTTLTTIGQHLCPQFHYSPTAWCLLFSTFSLFSLSLPQTPILVTADLPTCILPSYRL